MKRAMGELELALSLRAQGASSAEVRNLVTVAGALALVPDPEIDTAFADALEARLLTEGLESSPEVIQLRPVGQPARRTARPAAFAPKTHKVASVVPLPRRRFVVRKAIAVAIAAAMMLALPIAAGAQSLPSSPLYKVKIGMENARSFFTRGDLAKGFFELSRAQTRFDEASQEIELGHTDVAAATINRMKDHQRKGAGLILSASPSPADLERVEDLMRSLVDQLQGLLPKADSMSRPNILAAILSAETLANNLAGTSAEPGAMWQVLTLVQNVETAGSASVPSDADTNTPSTGDTGGNDSSNTPKSPSVSDPGGRVHDGVDQGCRVPGSANGLGDIVAPAAKVFCTQ